MYFELMSETLKNLLLQQRTKYPRERSDIDNSFKEDIDGYCNLVNEEIEDQCKICGLNRGK